MNLSSLGLAAALASVIAVAASSPVNVPKGWVLAGSAPTDYEVSTENVSPGANSVVLRSTVASQGFGTVMQTVSAEQYRGSRMRLSADVRVKDVTKWAGLWFRVDGGGRQDVIAFDNMSNRPLRGDMDWCNVSVVLDVAPQASLLAFGVLLDGEGQAWMKNVQLEAVSTSVPVTSSREQHPGRPQNLTFTD